jgi:glycine/D-amino acid oxidase-like deaminating enzyme
LWKAVNPPFSRSAPLSRSIEAEVVIVGAGIAGLSLGFHLADRQIETVILEASADPDAATAASAGIVASLLPRSSPLAVMKRLGGEAGGRLLRMVAESGRYTFDLIRDQAIECAAVQKGFMTPVFGARGAQAQSRLVTEWTSIRDDLRLADAEETFELSGCLNYASAIVDPTGGGLDPVAYAAGLAHAATVKGATIHCGEPARSVTRAGGRWVVETASGQVSARTVILCANGGNAELHPALAHTILPLPVCEVATIPLADSIRRHILPHGHTMTDASTDIFSIRFDRSGRLITACPVPGRLNVEDITRSINDRLKTSIPAYREQPLDYIWQGTAWLNSTLLPRVLLIDRGLMAVQACNGRGIALNTIIGRELAAYLVSPETVMPQVPLEVPKPVAGFWMARHLPRLIMAGPAFAKRVMQSLRLGPDAK